MKEPGNCSHRFLFHPNWVFGRGSKLRIIILSETNFVQGSPLTVPGGIWGSCYREGTIDANKKMIFFSDNNKPAWIISIWSVFTPFLDVFDLNVAELSFP
jgi:hypothetical protein